MRTHDDGVGLFLYRGVDDAALPSSSRRVIPVDRHEYLFHRPLPQAFHPGQGMQTKSPSSVTRNFIDEGRLAVAAGLEGALAFWRLDGLNLTDYVEKVLPWIFSTTEPENAISRFLYFQ